VKYVREDDVCAEHRSFDKIKDLIESSCGASNHWKGVGLDNTPNAWQCNRFELNEEQESIIRVIQNEALKSQIS
jgi:hypothetical protein